MIEPDVAKHALVSASSKRYVDVAMTLVEVNNIVSLGQFLFE